MTNKRLTAQEVVEKITDLTQCLLTVTCDDTLLDEQIELLASMYEDELRKLNGLEPKE